MYLGFDGGFYAIKGIGSSAHGRLLRCTFPSLVSKNTSAIFSLNGEDNMIIEFNDHKFLVGSGAVKRGTEVIRKESASWINTPEWLAMFYATLALLTDASHAKVTLTTGLPLSDFSRQKRLVHKILLGEHTFKRSGQSAQCITVSDCFVVPQAWGAILSNLIDKSGEIGNADLASERVAVIDIGGHNVNYLSVDGLTNVDNETHATERGAWVVMRSVRGWLNANAPELNRLSDHRIMEGIIKGSLGYAGSEILLHKATRPIIDDITTEILDTSAQRWGNGAKVFKYVFIIGGGAHLFGPGIKQAIPHAVICDLPEYTNADGYWRYSQYKAKRG